MLSLLGSVLGFGTSFLPSVMGFFEKKQANKQELLMLEAKAKYASELSKIGHVNCKTAPDLRELMSNFFNTVFIFSMNDEVVHTGFHKMAHYIFAVCCNKK